MAFVEERSAASSR